MHIEKPGPEEASLRYRAISCNENPGSRCLSKTIFFSSENPGDGDVQNLLHSNT